MDKNKIQSILSNNYKNNFRALKKRYPDLAKRTLNLIETNKYKVHPNKDNKTFNLYINNLNKFYYDEINPLYDVKLKIDSLKLRNTKLALFLGFGLGYETIYYMQSLAREQKTGAIIIIERDIEIFTMSLYTTNIVPIIENKNVHLLIDIEEENIFTEFEKLLSNSKYMTYVKAFNAIFYPTSLELEKKYYFDVLKSFKESAIHVITFVGNSPDDSLLGLRNMFENLETIIQSPGINLLYDKFRNKPAIIVASGPSLKKNMHLLNDIREKALIICAESTFRILMNNGIKPHMMALLERPNRVFDFENLSKDEVEDIYLAGCPVIPSKAYDSFLGPNIIVYRKFAHFTWLDIDRGMLDIKQSSANMAFKIAMALGCNPIVLIGQDLAFDKESKDTHANYHVHGTNQDLFHKQKVFEVKGNDGQPILTSDSWYQFLKSYEIDIANFNGTCINATEGGAYIAGTKIMKFSEAISQYIVNDIYPLDIIKESINDFMINDKSNDKFKIMKKIDIAVLDIDQIINYCHEGFDFIENIEPELSKYIHNNKLNKEETDKIMNYYSKIVEFKNKIQNFSDTFQLLIMHIVQSIYIKFEIDMNEIPRKYDIYELAIAEIIIKHKDWFGNINNLSLIVQDELKETKVRLE